MSDAGTYIVVVLQFLIGGVFTVLWYFIKQRMTKFDKHIEECHERRIETGKMEEKLVKLEAESSHSRSTLHWVGDCLMIIGTKMNAELPPRPER